MDNTRYLKNLKKKEVFTKKPLSLKTHKCLEGMKSLIYYLTFNFGFVINLYYGELKLKKLKRKNILLFFDNQLKYTNLFSPIFFFIVFTIIMTWPLVLHISSSILGPLGDNLYFVWLIKWLKKCIFEIKQNPYVVPFLNYPLGWNLAYTEISLSNVIPALLVSLIGGSILGYNIVILVSFILSGLIVYWWVKSITGDVGAGLVGGFIFAFSSYRMAHANGHLHLMGTQWLGLYFFGLYYILQKRTFSWKYALITGLGLGLASCSSLYYLYMTLIVSFFFIIGYMLFIERKIFLKSVFWKNLSASILIALPFIIVSVLPHLYLIFKDNVFKRPLSEVKIWSASLTDFFLPAPTHFIWGNWIDKHFDRSLWVEQTLYIGLITLFLIFIALIYPKKHLNSLKTIKLFIWSIFWAILLSMGVTLHWFGKEVIIKVPSIFQHLGLKSQIPIILPNYLLFKFLPFYSGLRVWMRYGVYVSLFTAIIAGVGYKYFSKEIFRKVNSKIIFVVILVLISIDFYPKFQIFEVKARPIDQWLATQKGKGAVVQFPIELSTLHDYVYGSFIHNKPLLGMPYGSFFPSNFIDILPLLQKFPDKDSVELLRKRGVQYVIVDFSKYSEWKKVRNKILSLGLTLKTVIGNYGIYEIKRIYKIKNKFIKGGWIAFRDDATAGEHGVILRKDGSIVSNLHITGNEKGLNGVNGITLDGANKCIVVSNILRFLVSAVWINGTNYNSIMNNVIEHPQHPYWDIVLSNNSAYNTLLGNIMDLGITDYSYNNDIAHNIIY